MGSLQRLARTTSANTGMLRFAGRLHIATTWLVVVGLLLLTAYSYYTNNSATSAAAAPVMPSGQLHNAMHASSIPCLMSG